MIGIGVIGCGYWGPNVVRNFSSIERSDLRALCDRDPARLDGISRRYPAARTYADARALLDDPSVDAVAICTPVAEHFPLASAALEAGKHVMIEKPLTDSVESSEKLVKLAESKGLTLHVDHTFVYTGAVQRIRQIVDSGELGDMLYIDCVRVNLGLFQSDVNVVWDLAPHDVSILGFLIDSRPTMVSAIGRAHLGELESQAYLTVEYENGVLAHVHVNWLAPVKVRSTLIGGSKRMIVYDDLEPSEKLRIYDKGVTFQSDPASRVRALVDYRMGDMFAPYIDKTEPLERACRTFLDAVETGVPSGTDGRAGLAVVRVLEAAQRSIRREGERIPLGSPR